MVWVNGVPGDTLHRCVVNDSIRRHTVGVVTWIPIHYPEPQPLPETPPPF